MERDAFLKLFKPNEFNELYRKLYLRNPRAFEQPVKSWAEFCRNYQALEKNQENSYFDGLIFSNFPDSYPLASFLYTVVVKRDMSLLSMEQIREMAMVDDRTIRCAQIFISLIPIMIIYPFAQKYFVKGMTVGSVKG